jgi:hypothetical protein
MNVAIGTFLDFLKKIGDSSKLLEALEISSSNLKMESLLPSLDFEARWNSTWQMVSGIIKIRKPLEELQRLIREGYDGFTNFSITPNRSARKGHPGRVLVVHARLQHLSGCL